MRSWSPSITLPPAVLLCSPRTPGVTFDKAPPPHDVRLSIGCDTKEANTVKVKENPPLSCCLVHANHNDDTNMALVSQSWEGVGGRGGGG